MAGGDLTSEGGVELLKGADRALKNYIRTAEHLIDQEEKSDQEMKDVLERETKRAIVFQPV